MTSDAAPPSAQLSETMRQSAARIESVAAELVALRARIDSLDARVDAGNTAVQQSVERAEALRNELGRIGRLEAALVQLRNELSHEQDVRQRALHDEVHGLQARMADETRRLGLEVGLLVQRIDTVEALSPRLDGLERERAGLARTVQAQEPRLDALAAERAAYQEDLRRVEQRAQARLEAIQAQLRDQETELDQWRGRIESQAESVREARAVADHMQDQALRLGEDHHALAEAERLFEQHVEGLLTEMRREAIEEWQRFRRERAADWATLTRANEARDGLDQTLVERVDAILARLGALEADVPAGLAARANEVRAVRQDLAGALGAWRQALGEATEIVEATVGQAETPAAVEERRQALRRALRAQRAAREG
jgi:chromosome segregation ATPase